MVAPKFNLQYFIVPLNVVVEHKIEQLLDPRIKDALVFYNNGLQYIKWPIHPEDRKYYLGIKEPGFSIIQSKNLPALKALVARVLGKNPNDISNEDLSDFVSNHYAKPAGAALGELLAYFGIYMISLHGQQLLVQIDSKGIPTGKIVLRDFTDGILINRMLPDQRKAQKMQCCFMPQKFLDFFVVLNLIRFHITPTYANEIEKRKWMLDYENAFNHILSQITGVPATYKAGYVHLLGRTQKKYYTRKWIEYLGEFHQSGRVPVLHRS